MKTHMKKPTWNLAFNEATHLLYNNGKNCGYFFGLNTTEGFKDEEGTFISNVTINTSRVVEERPSDKITTIEGKEPFEGATHILYATAESYPPYIFAKNVDGIMVGEFNSQLPSNIYRYHSTLHVKSPSDKVFDPDGCEKVIKNSLNSFLSKPTWDQAFKSATHIIRKNNMIEEQCTFHFAKCNKFGDYLGQGGAYFEDFEVIEGNPSEGAVNITSFNRATDRANRFNDGKPQLSLVLEAGLALTGCAKVLEFGAQKYDRSNWKKGLEINSIMDSMTRHQLALMSGETIDPESGLPHVDHILCNAMFMSEMWHEQTTINK